MSPPPPPPPALPAPAPTPEPVSRTREPTPSDAFLERIPRDFARRHLILSAGVEHGVEQLRVSPGTLATAVFNTRVKLGRPTSVAVTPADELATAIDRAYADFHHERGGAGRAGAIEESTCAEHVTNLQGSSDVAAEMEAALRMAAADGDVLNTHGKGPTVRLVDLVLFEALMRGASDVHVQPVRGRALIRYRLDGVLHTARELPGSLASAVVSRIKVMGRLDVAEQRSPQDGRASITVGTPPAPASPPGGGSSGTVAAERTVETLRDGTNRLTEEARATGSDTLSSSGKSGGGFGAGRVPGEAGSGGGGGGGAFAGRRVDLRISTLPSTYGERVVVRLLDPARSPHLKSFAALGMPREVERLYLQQCSKTSGIVLSTGPTGSGKTTTLYATLAWMCATNSDHGPGQSGCELNVMTVEDPVEYDLSDGGAAGTGLAVSQTQVDPKKNVTFITGLRHILRQDPDVIMIGEIRDAETARMAVQSSLTGHLVLSTLHTNDAPSAIARLLDLGVEPFLVSSSLSAVLAQRLVRKVHPACGGRGCHGNDGCVGTGYRGRMGVFELLVLDHPLREMVCARCSAIELKEAAQRRGMVTLREAGSELVAAGITTEEEVTRVIEALGEQA